MRRQLNRNRFFISQWYMGAGDLISIFSQKSNKPFENLKMFYSKKFKNARVNINQKKLTREQKEKIKKDFKRQYNLYIIKQIFVFIISIVISTVILIALGYSFNYIITKI